MIPAGLIPFVPFTGYAVWLLSRWIWRRLRVRKEVKKARVDMQAFDEEVEQWLNGKS